VTEASGSFVAAPGLPEHIAPVHANLARSQRTPHFHEHPPARLGKTGLTPSRLAVDQFQQVVAGTARRKDSPSNNCLLHRANAFHDLGTLPHNWRSFFVRAFTPAAPKCYWLSIDRMQTITIIFPNFHKCLLQLTANDRDPSALVF